MVVYRHIRLDKNEVFYLKKMIANKKIDLVKI